MKTIWTRLTSETPTFFKKIRNIGFSSISLGTVIIAIPATFATIVFPPALIAIGGYLIAGGIVAVKVSSLVVVDQSVLDKLNEIPKTNIYN